MQKQNSQNLKHIRTFSVLLILIGVIQLAYMIIVEDEPGALPLLLLTTGTIVFTSVQLKIKKQNS